MRTWSGLGGGPKQGGGFTYGKEKGGEKVGIEVTICYREILIKKKIIF